MSAPRREVIGDAELWLGDCREVLAGLGPVDAVVTDPPYGIGKADWDTEFPLDWFDDAAKLADIIAVMPGTWNLLCLPKARAGLKYRWTLSAHLTNGMTRGAMGWGNWIPCVVYKRDLGGLQPEHVREWCRRFAEWCGRHGVTKRSLDEVCGTSDMGGWYLGLLPYRCQIPAPHQWAKISKAFGPPGELEPEWIGNDYQPRTDCKAFAIGGEPKPNHPSPKPLNVTRWFVETIGGGSVLDPFMGSGTTGVACVKLGRRFFGIENVPAYFDLACRRIEAAHRQADLFVERPAPRPEQATLALGDAV